MEFIWCYTSGAVSPVNGFILCLLLQPNILFNIQSLELYMEILRSRPLQRKQVTVYLLSLSRSRLCLPKKDKEIINVLGMDIT